MFGAISGGHFNPAVTVMMWAKGEEKVSTTNDVTQYIVAQVLGGVAAYYAHKIINKK